jgi:hypothetical protein
MKTVVVWAVLTVGCGVALAKLPPPDEAAKAKAAETTAKAAWQAKVDAFLLCRAQDKVVAAYKSSAKASPRDGRVAAAPPSGAQPVPAQPAAAQPAAGAQPPAAQPGAAAQAAAAAQPAPPNMPAASPNVAAAPAQGAAATTPVAFTVPPPCADPGPFAYNPPEQKPLETSGAHSPSGTAASPPSVRAPSAAMAPAKKP